MALTFIVTNAGRAALVNAANTGTAPVVIAQVGISATALAPTPATAALPGEFKRLATLSGDVVADDTIHLIVRDESSDVFTVRSIGLYLGDGTLFGLYGQAPVLLEKSAQAMMLLGIDVRFEEIAATNITFGDANFLNPPATTEQIGVVELATVAEAQAGIDALRSLTPAAAKAAVLGWLLAQDGAGSGLDADLLDGQDGSYYSNIPARLGYTPVQQSGGTGQGPGKVYIGWGGTRLKATVDVTDLGNVVFDANLALGGLDINGAYMRRNGFHLFGPDNDGAGSGLDADLLDGQDGSYYSNITARLGYTPVNKAGDTMSGALTLPTVNVAGPAGTNGMTGGNGDGASYSLYNLTFNAWWGVGFKTYDGSVNGFYDARAGRWDVKAGYRINGVDVWHPGNDGSGSGMDADLLDGQDGTFYTNIPARLGFTPVQQSGGAGQGLSKIYIGWGGSRLKCTVDLTDQGNFVFDANLAGGGLDVNGSVMRRGSYQLFGPDNDGSGSGMDADLLDGLQASDFVKYVNFTKATNYEILPDGRILQWGFADALPTRTTTTITFPIAFPNGALQMLASLGTSLTLSENRVGCGAACISNTQGNIALPANFGGTIGVTWLAIGH